MPEKTKFSFSSTQSSDVPPNPTTPGNSAFAACPGGTEDVQGINHSLKQLQQIRLSDTFRADQVRQFQ
jgi:hypothetical protein